MKFNEFMELKPGDMVSYDETTMVVAEVHDVNRGEVINSDGDIITAEVSFRAVRLIWYCGSCEKYHLFNPIVYIDNPECESNRKTLDIIERIEVYELYNDEEGER